MQPFNAVRGYDMTFNFNKLNARFTIYGGDLEKALFSVQKKTILI